VLQINYWYENKILDKDSYNIKDAFFDLENKKRINKKNNDVNHLRSQFQGRTVYSSFLTQHIAEALN